MKVDVRPITRRALLRTGTIAALGLLVPAGLPGNAGASLRAGDAVPPFALPDLGGNLVKLPAGLSGKVVVIHFWASWCSSCRSEVRMLESLYGKLGAREFSPCSIGVGEKRETAASYLQNIAVSYPVLLDPDSSTVKAFGITSIPTYYIVDRKGLIRYRILGVADKAGLERIIGTL